jgi:hypothetical protein
MLIATRQVKVPTPDLTPVLQRQPGFHSRAGPVIQ